MSRLSAILRQAEEAAMKMKLHKIRIDVEKFNAIINANDECPEQLLGSGPGSLTSQYQQPEKTMADQEYVRLMEERYGIREEGIF
jgi:hypothetical protein